MHASKSLTKVYTEHKYGIKLSKVPIISHISNEITIHTSPSYYFLSPLKYNQLIFHNSNDQTSKNIPKRSKVRLN